MEPSQRHIILYLPASTDQQVVHRLAKSYQQKGCPLIVPNPARIYKSHEPATLLQHMLPVSIMIQHENSLLLIQILRHEPWNPNHSPSQPKQNAVT